MGMRKNVNMGRMQFLILNPETEQNMSGNTGLDYDYFQIYNIYK